MKSRDLRGKRIVITGASSGIGRALAVAAAGRGCRIVANGRDERRLQETVELARKAGGEIAPAVADVTDPADREKLLRVAEQQFGGLDILVNNAGLGATGHFQYAAPDRLRKLMEVNFFAPCELCRLAIPMLKDGVDPAILMINSVAGRRAIPSRSEYSASKFALMGFSEALRAELIKDGIEVTVVSPGLTESSFEEHMLENKARHSLHKDRWMSADEAAELIMNALAARKNETTLTFKGKLLVFLNRMLPRFIDRKMAQFVRKLYAEEIMAAKVAAGS